ncbi:hypothetical protein AAB992_25280 [Burkholderia contaminans]|uniref:hypothetical protein n=1 Tax=Burkholderia contaminans TaxID=488447 RepID=UPI002416AB45|nr:hypothetical protein [Burkholderia contaminans]WFN14625.1 hypothetical protein LXE92_37715 [Burkholderia contaminans]
MQTRSFDADERADRAGAADQFHHACCGNTTTINTRRRCRLPEGRTGRRARCGSVAATGRPRRAAPDRTADRTADRAACAGQLAAIVRFERRRTMRERYFALIQFR